MGLGFNLSAQYTAIPDPNFELYLEAAGMGDGIYGNGQVLTANIENVTLVNVSNRNIHDLTGIEDFASLELLGCYDNPITHLDVSHNNQLKTLACHNSELESIILNNPNLETLVCSNNDITTINLSNCPLLNHLEIEDNNLISLDLSNNPLLRIVWCGDNNLSEINITNNTLLDRFDCSRNQITSLDLTQNINLTSFGALYNPPLNNVDIRSGSNETIVEFNSNGTNSLKCIYVDDAEAPYLENWFKDDFTHFVNNEQECDALGTEDFFKFTFSIYPNPVLDKLTIENLELEIESIKITEASGKQIFQQNANASKIEIDFTHYPKGVYYITFESKGKTTTEKVIKK